MKRLKSAKSLHITELQRRNLAKLVMFVKKAVPPPKFNIIQYNDMVDCAYEANYECGTTACLCGYGPLAGIKAEYPEKWGAYSTRVFGAWERGFLWKTLFSPQHRNNKTAAVKRGAYILMHGLPDCKDPSEWEVPRGFKPDWEAIRRLAEKAA